MSNKICYPAVFQKEDVGYSVWVPDIQGCVSQGDNFEEAVQYITEAVGLCLEDDLERGTKPPVPSEPNKIELEENQFVSVIMFDPIEYQQKYSTKSVRKIITIPCWLNTMSEHENINFSAVLQEALMEKLHLTNNL